MAVLWVGWGTLVRPELVRSARRWAAVQPAGRAPGAAARLALSLLGHYGRRLAAGALVGVRSLETIRARTVVEGAEHLTSVEPTTPTILLGFHLGPPQGWLALRAMGRDVVFVGVPDTARTSSRRAQVVGPPTRRLSMPGTGGATARLSVLATAHRLLIEGRTLWIAGDGPWGEEVFRIPLPGGPLAIRSGWFALRRRTGAVTLPMLTRRAGRHRRVVVVHPPLPPPHADLEEDVAICRAALTALVEDFVRCYPEQCTLLALRRVSGPGSAALALHV